MLRDHAVGALSLAHVRGLALRNEGGGACERLGGDRLRHPGQPRSATARVREGVLPRDAAARLVHAACDQRIGEALRRVGIVRGDVRVQRTEVRERVKLEASPCEVAVDDAVLVGDVRLRCRRIVLHEVVVVCLQLADERERARLGHSSRERGELPERDGDVLAPAAWERARKTGCAPNLGSSCRRRRGVDVR